MSAENQPLKRTKGNIIGPNYYNRSKDEFEFIEGSWRSSYANCGQ